MLSAASFVGVEEVPVPVALPVALPVVVVEVLLLPSFSDFINTQISFVASLDIKILPFESRTRPTGLKQSSGHFELSGFAKISFAAVVLSDAATGSPFAQSITETLYPTGASLSLLSSA